MQIGFIGLGRMGFGMVERLLKHKVGVVAYNRSQDKIKTIVKKGAQGARSVEDLVGQLKGKKIVWLMLPAGDITDKMLKSLIPLLSRGDIIIDGANDFYGNAQRHSQLCAKYGINFFDCGVSGGIWGLKNGYTLMIGGPQNQFKKIEPLCQALAPKGGYGYFGPVGSGHFVKSVHNIVEYIYLQGLAEGVELLNNFKSPIDFKKISPKIDSVTIDELQKTVKALKGFTPAFDVAAKIRQDKGKKFTLGKRTIAAVRREFGGHNVVKN